MVFDVVCCFRSATQVIILISCGKMILSFQGGFRFPITSDLFINIHAECRLSPKFPPKKVGCSKLFLFRFADKILWIHLPNALNCLT